MTNQALSWQNCLTNWRCLSDMLMNRTPIPRLTTFSSGIFAFDHATWAVTSKGSSPGHIMVILKIFFSRNGLLQEIKAPPRLRFFISASMVPQMVSIKTGQLTSNLGCWRFSGPPFRGNFADIRESRSEGILFFQKQLTIQTTKNAKKNAIAPQINITLSIIPVTPMSCQFDGFHL